MNDRLSVNANGLIDNTQHFAACPLRLPSAWMYQLLLFFREPG